MTASEQNDQVPERIVNNRAVAVFIVLASAGVLCLRVRHVSARFRAPEGFWVTGVFHGAVGVGLDGIIYIGLVIVMLGLIGSTRDGVEKVGIIAGFANFIIKPIALFWPAWTAAIWWIDLGLLLVFFLASVAALMRLSRRPLTYN